jgi:hypothetical protein
MKKLPTSQDFFTINKLKNILETNNINCFIKNLYLSGAMGELPPQECYPELWVMDDNDYSEALTLIEQNQNSAVAGKPWTCEQCGEQIEAQFNVCWKCGDSQS